VSLSGKLMCDIICIIHANFIHYLKLYKRLQAFFKMM